MIIDSHCHLHDPAFADTRGVVTRAAEHHVWGAVAVGCDPETNRRTLLAAAAHGKSVWAALGFHPERAELTDGDLEAVEEQIRSQHSKIVALGEVGVPWYGLDGAADASGVLARGRRRFERLLGTAVRFDLPVVVHAPHGAAEIAFDALRAKGVERAVFHWHKAAAGVTRAIVDAGYFVSVTPEVVYRDRDRELVEAVPLTSLLVESDGPWPYRGEFEGMPSGPWLVGRVAEEVAKIKHLPVEETMYQLSVNTCQLFDLVWA